MFGRDGHAEPVAARVFGEKTRAIGASDGFYGNIVPRPDAVGMVGEVDLQESKRELSCAWSTRCSAPWVHAFRKRPGFSFRTSWTVLFRILNMYSFVDSTCASCMHAPLHISTAPRVGVIKGRLARGSCSESGGLVGRPDDTLIEPKYQTGLFYRDCEASYVL